MCASQHIGTSPNVHPCIIQHLLDNNNNMLIWSLHILLTFNSSHSNTYFGEERVFYHWRCLDVLVFGDNNKQNSVAFMTVSNPLCTCLCLSPGCVTFSVPLWTCHGWDEPCNPSLLISRSKCDSAFKICFTHSFMDALQALEYNSPYLASRVKWESYQGSAGKPAWWLYKWSHSVFVFIRKSITSLLRAGNRYWLNIYNM